MVFFGQSMAQPYSIIKNDITTILPGHHEGIPSSRRLLILQFKEDVMIKRSSLNPIEKGMLELKKGSTLEIIGSCSENYQKNYSEPLKESAQEGTLRILSGCAAFNMLTIAVSNKNYWEEYMLPDPEIITIAAP